MKVMDVPMESEENVASVPPKKKKLIQALLPFQMLGSSPSSKASLNKKRKNVSPSAGECRSPKMVKITSEENSNEKAVSEKKLLDEKPLDKKFVENANDSRVLRENPLDKQSNEIVDDEAASRDKRADKIPAELSDKPASRNPVVLLFRLEDGPDEKENSEASIVPASEEHDENVASMQSDDSSNEELARELDDSGDEKVAKARSDASSDAPVGISDSESEAGVSSSDDETDEAKIINENERQDDKKAFNGSGLDRTPTSGVKSNGTNAARRRLTPKQLEKKMETTKRREERRMERMEKEKKREEERQMRQKEKESRRREKKEKEEAEKEQKRKEKEQKELKKQLEIEQKQKEKERKDRAKEEDRKKREEAKEEEKRKKEEERLEAERKKQKAASTFVSFFVPKKPETRVIEEKELVRTSNFMPFQIKVDMRVAPVCRRSLNEAEKNQFDEVCIDKIDGTERLFVTEIKNRDKRKSGKTWVPESKDDVVIVEDDEVGSCNMIDQTNATVEKQRAKLLAFAENRRPPYWGTWRKQSVSITPRRPFQKDSKWFDYDVDSDEEWEEEEPGESLRGSDDERDEENPDDNEYDVDNEFMVPHGYLSEEEAQDDEDEEEDMTPELQKDKLKILGEEFEAERKTQTSKIKPKVVGCIWQGPLNSYPENTPENLVDFLTARQAWVRETPIILAPPTPGENTSGTENTGSANEEKRGAKKTIVPEEALPELIRLIHGNTHGRGFLVKEFMTFWNRKKNNEKSIPLSKSSVGQKIREFARRMACPEEGPMHLKACWYVPEETRKNYLGDENLELPNRWNYALTPKRKSVVEHPKIVEKLEKEEKEKDRKNVPLITQFTKKITQEEMKKQLNVKTSQTLSPRASTSQAKAPKRVQLISVPRGEQFPKSKIMDALTKAQTSIISKSTNSPSEAEIIDVSEDAEIETGRTIVVENSSPAVVDLDSSSDSTKE